MKHTIRLIVHLFFGTLLLTNCHQEDPLENFQINTKEATSQLQSIMFNGTTSQNNLSMLKNGYERFKIVHISDPHLSNWTADNHYVNPVNLKEAIRFANLPEARINALVATGDFIGNMDKTDRSDAMMYLHAFCNTLFSNNTIPSFVCTGNHETNMLTDNTSYYLEKQTLHDLLFATKNYTLHQPGGENYYYADLKNPAGGIIRIIALDNTDQEGFDYNSLQTCCITPKQVDWLIQTALTEGMTEKHSIILLNHHPLQSFSKDQSTYMCSGTHLYGSSLVPDIVDAFIRKQTLDRSYTTTIAPYRTLHVKANFTQTAGEFICYLGGHAHTPAHFEVTCNNPSAAKQIMLLANTSSPEMQNNSYIYIKRDKEGLSSNSFSIYAIDTQEKKIYITYFGAKSSYTNTIETISYR